MNNEIQFSQLHRKKLYSHGMPYSEFAVRIKLKKIIESKKSIIMDPRINIQPVNAQYFFHMVQKKKPKKFLWISCVSMSNCKCYKTNGSNT